MAKIIRHRQTKKYYELQSDYQEALKRLKTQQAIILAPIPLAIQLEIKQHPMFLFLVNLTILFLSFELTTPYYRQESLLPLWLRIVFSLALTLFIDILLLFLIIKYQKEEYIQEETQQIEHIQNIYQKLNQQYDKMKKEQLQNIDFSINPKPKKQKIHLFRKKDGDSLESSSH